MKLLFLVTLISLAASFGMRAAASPIADQQYSGQAAVIGAQVTAAPVAPPVVRTPDYSSRLALLAPRPEPRGERPSAFVSSYNSKTTVQGQGPAAVELAPLK